MSGGMSARRFIAGAVGGLALALLLVAAVSISPRLNQAPTFEASPALATTSTSTALAQATPAEAPGPQFAGAAISGPSSTTAAAAAPSSTSSVQAKQAPASFLTALPKEGAASLVATTSPLLVGLLVAVLVYGVYVRRQDSG